MTHKMASPGADRPPAPPPPRYASAFKCCGAHFYCCDENDFVDRIQLWHRLACDSDCWIIVIFRTSKQNRTTTTTATTWGGDPYDELITICGGNLKKTKHSWEIKPF